MSADLAAPAILRTNGLPWRASARAGVMRRELERGDGHAPRTAASIVHFDAGTGFPRHYHYVGEEILVLDGVFSDETGDFGAGTYLRNPTGSWHGPYSKDGCTIFIELLPDHAPDERNLIVDSTQMDIGLPPRPFTSLSVARREVAMSRVYGGIHYMKDRKSVV